MNKPVLLALLLLPGATVAQTSPGWIGGETPTPRQWNALFGGKIDLKPATNWLAASGYHLAWPVSGALAAILSTNGQIALSAASRSSDLSAGYGSLQTTIGLIGIGIGDNPYGANGLHKTAYGGYFEGDVYGTSQDIAWGIETDAVNFGVVQTAPTPLHVESYGSAVSLNLASGGQHTGVADATAAISVLNNGARFQAGRVIGQTALTRSGVFSYGDLFPLGTMTQWYDATGANPTVSLTSTVAAAANAMSQQFQDGGLLWLNAAGHPLASIQNINNAVNSLTLVPSVAGSPVSLTAAGSDANIELNLTPKGTGAVYDTGSLSVAGTSYFAGNASFGGTAYVGSTLSVAGTSSFTGNASFAGQTYIPNAAITGGYVGSNLLTQNGATPNQVLTWNGASWMPSNIVPSGPGAPGGIISGTGGPHQFVTGVSTAGTLIYGQPVAADTSDFATAVSADAPVQTVAGRTGRVTLAAADISGLAAAASAAAPVQSVAGRTGAVTLAAADVSGLAAAASASAPVQTVAGRTGAVVLAVADVSGAEQTANRGTAGGYANLDTNTLVPIAEVPSQTPDALTAAAAMFSTDEVLMRQSGTTLLRGTLANLQTFVLAGLPGYLQPVSTVSAPTTLNAAVNAGIVAVSTAGTVSLDAGATSDGWHADIANTSTGLVTLAAINGGALSGAGVATVLPGNALHVFRRTTSGTPTFYLAGGTPAPQISVNTVPGVLSGSTVMVTGTYINTTLTGLQYALNGSTWTAAAGATIGSGSFSFAVAGLSVGSYTIAVRDVNNTGNFSSAANFGVASSNQVTVNTPAGTLQGQGVGISGSYIGTPASIQYAFDTNSGWLSLVSSPAGGSYSATVAAPSVGSHTVYTRFPDASVTSSPSGSFSVTGIPAITLAQPANVAAAAALAMSGTYTYDAPSGLQWSVNGGATWNNTTSPTISGGNWSFSIPGLASAYYFVSARLTDSPSAVATIVTPVAVGTAMWAGVPTTLAGGSSFTFPVLSSVGVQQFYTNWAATPAYAWQAYYNGTPQTSFTSNAVQAPANAGTYQFTISSTQVGASATYTIPVTAPTSQIISLDTYYGSGYPYAGSASVSSPITVTGEYGGGTPTALDYQWDTKGWQSNGTATINVNGTFSLVIPAPTTLTTGVKHSLYVAFHSNPGSASFNWNAGGVTMTP